MEPREEQPTDERLRLEVARLLTGPHAAGLSASQRQQALQVVLGPPDATIPRLRILRWLHELALPETAALLKEVEKADCERAVEIHRLRLAGLPLSEELQAFLGQCPPGLPVGFADQAPPLSWLGEAVSLYQDRLFLDREPEARPAAAAAVAEALEQRLPRLRTARWCDPLAILDRALGAGELPPALSVALTEARARLDASDGESAEEKTLRLEAEAARASPLASRESLVDRLLAWPDRRLIDPLIALCSEPGLRARAMIGLSLRFGQPLGADWNAWTRWLWEQRPAGRAQRAMDAGLEPLLLLALLAEDSANPLHSAAALLRQHCAASLALPSAPYFLDRWSSRIPEAEARALRGLPPAVASLPLAAATAQEEQRPVVETPVEPTGPPAAPVAAEPPAVPEAIVPPVGPLVEETPSPWRQFVTENANLLAGIAMVLVGGSLVAYFTWDRHWLFRYTLVPGLFALFTGGLALVARWLERNDAALSGTAAMLRGAAIALLPANCMSVSLLADDPMVTGKWIAVPLMAALYLAVMTLGLRRWTSAVHPALGAILAPGLLFLNALVLVRPLARVLAEAWGLRPSDVFACGFYLGFLVAAETMRRFATRVLDAETAREGRVVWFASGTLAITFLQVLGWVHAWERQWPPLALYGPLIVLCGGLAFFVERRFRQALGDETATAEESFIGFALILAGEVASFGDAYLRIVAGLLAGVLWLYQAAFRKSPLHTYLGLLLLTLAGAAIALLPGFPLSFSPALGLGLALGMGGIAVTARRFEGARVEAAAWELQRALLVLTGIIAVLTHYHFKTPPVYTALALLAVAGTLLRRAVAAEGRREGFIAAMMAAMALPYLGFADMQGHDFAGNTLTLGLALLGLGWIALVRVSASPALRSVRSAALSLYGIFALAAMAARVLLERKVEVPPSLWTSMPEYLGPLLMLGVLILTTHFTRSMLPFIVGLLLVFALLPGLKADFQVLAPGLSWGSGLGSAVSALTAIAVAVVLRSRPWPEEQREADRLFDGSLLPLQRAGHALFTTPLIGLAVGLALRVDLYTTARNFGAGPPLKTVAAVLLTSIVWTLVAVWRRDATGAVCLRLGVAALFWGFWLIQHRAGDPWALEGPLLWTGLVLQAAEIGCAIGLLPRRSWAREFLIEPTRAWLSDGALLAGAGTILALLAGSDPARLRWLGLFVLAQLVRRALSGFADAGPLFAMLAFVGCLAEASPGTGPLLQRLSYEHTLWPVLAFALGVQVVSALLELRAQKTGFLLPLLDPARLLSGLVLGGLSWLALTNATSPERFGWAAELLVAVGLILVGRWTAAGPTTLLASVVAYLAILHPGLMGAGGAAACLRLIADPLGLALLSLALAAGLFIVRRLRGWPPQALISAWPGPGFGARVTPWLHLPAAAAAVLAVLRHSLVPGLRHDAGELAATFLSALALLILASVNAPAVLGWSASAALALGNLHALQLSVGDVLRVRGLSDIHLAALAVAASVLEMSVLRVTLGRLIGESRVTRVLHVGCALVLALLSANFTADPNLTDLTPERLLVSGTLALAAGWFFRRLSLADASADERQVALAHALYHFGVAMALWCLVLLVPAFRSPIAALAGLAVPAAYFQVAGERFRSSDPPRALRYVRSATVIAGAVIFLYAARPLFQSVFFPDSQIRSDYYHYNAALVLALGFLLLRSNAFEANRLAGTVGGAAIFAGAFFGVASLPGLSPFEARFPAAWLAIALAHGFTWLITDSRRCRDVLARFARIEGPFAEALASAWHLLALLGTLAVVIAALVHRDAAVYGSCAVLAGVASVWIRRGPPNRLATLPIAGLLVAASVEAVSNPALLSEAGLVALALISIRHDPGPFTMAAALGVYVISQHAELVAAISEPARFSVVSESIPLVLLGLALALLVEGERRRWAGRSARLLAWLGGLAAVFSLIAVLRPRATDLDLGLAQIGVDYAAVLTHALLAVWPGAEALGASATALLVLAHLGVVERFAAPTLTAHGLGYDHRLGLALGMTLLSLWPLRGMRRGVTDLRTVTALSLGTVLLGHYALAPGLLAFTAWRGVLVALLWLVAGAALREAAARPQPGGSILLALHHLSTAFAIVAFALAFPAMRTSALSLLTLALPSLYFLVRCELAQSEDQRHSHRDAGVVAGLIVLPFYVSRMLSIALLEPASELPLRHYHTQAAVLMLVGLLLARLHRHGAALGVALAAGFSMMVASYFAITAFPGLSPFDFPVEGAFAGIALLHVWTLATTPHASTTGLLRSFAGLDEADWSRLRTLVGLGALWGAHLLVFAAIVDSRRPSTAVAPLLAGAASLLLHHGYQRGLAIYFDLGAIELIAALHADVVLPSYLPLERVVWVLLGLRAVFVGVVSQYSWSPAAGAQLSRWGVVLSGLVLAHVAYHRPWSDAGLEALALLALSVALVPRASAGPANPGEALVALSLIATPIWLVHFAWAPWAELGPRALWVTDPLLRTMMAALLTAVAARSARSWAGEADPRKPLALHQARHLLLSEGVRIHRILVTALSAVSAVLILSHYGVAYSAVELVLLTTLLVGLGAAWYRRGRLQKSWVECFVAEIHVAAAFGLLRRQLLLTTEFWSYEYDLWLSLAASAVLTGVKQRLASGPEAREVERPVTLSLLLIPVVALYWTVVNGLGADMVLLVVGLNSVLFAFLGHDRRNSPYNLLAVSGFVSFVVLLFWAKLHLRVLHAYVVPVSLGVLLLGQLFEKDLTRPALARIRLACLAAMLGSTGYHALLDERYPVTFNLTLLVLCLAAVALGGLWQVRLYVMLGLAVLMLDLASLAAKALTGMESQTRMTWIGLGVFVLGALIVALGVYHKGRQAEVEGRLARWRDRFSSWQ